MTLSSCGKVRERLARSQIFHMQRFKLINVEGKEKYHTEDSNGFAAFQDLDFKVHTGWETIRGNTKISAKENLDCYEMKKHGSTNNVQTY
jgi:hypothetical protein